jgi:hypothetical protein
MGSSGHGDLNLAMVAEPLITSFNTFIDTAKILNLNF